QVVGAIRYAGNISFAADPNKIVNGGLSVLDGEPSPVIPALPIHFDCRVVSEVRLGTHIMFLGEVESIRVRADLSPTNPLEWYPWADVRPVPSEPPAEIPLGASAALEVAEPEHESVER
ncbi:MAG: flavin reductase, partial [Verrucomicrobiaceae bacterium]